MRVYSPFKFVLPLSLVPFMVTVTNANGSLLNSPSKIKPFILPSWAKIKLVEIGNNNHMNVIWSLNNLKIYVNLTRNYFF